MARNLTLADTLARLRALGNRCKVQGGNIRIRGKIDPVLAAGIRLHRDAILGKKAAAAPRKAPEPVPAPQAPATPPEPAWGIAGAARPVLMAPRRSWELVREGDLAGFRPVGRLR